jgi:hypothetical protein
LDIEKNYCAKPTLAKLAIVSKTVAQSIIRIFWSNSLVVLKHNIHCPK